MATPPFRSLAAVPELAPPSRTDTVVARLAPCACGFTVLRDGASVVTPNDEQHTSSPPCTRPPDAPGRSRLPLPDLRDRCRARSSAGERCVRPHHATGLHQAVGVEWTAPPEEDTR